MYNMEISLFGYKIELELLILMCVIYLIVVGHTLCGCCSFSSPLLEGMVNKGNNNDYAPYSLGDNSQINTSNWGAYAVEAALAALVNRPEIMHTAEIEKRMLEACVATHAADGSTGRHIMQV